jgi:hypothetical protein
VRACARISSRGSIVSCITPTRNWGGIDVRSYVQGSAERQTF